MTYDNLQPIGFFVKDDVPLDMLYHLCTPERLSYRRGIEVFFMKNSANYDTRVRVKFQYGLTLVIYGWKA
jgi:hypothetical protein